MAKQKTLMTFDKVNEVLEQQQRNAEKRQEANEKAQAAAAKLELLRQQYEEELVKGVESETDNADKLNKLEKDIAQAEREVKRAKEAAEVARKYFQSTVNKDEFKAAFNEFKNEYKEKEVEPLLEAMRQTKMELTKQFREYQDAIAHYERQRDNAKNVYDPTGRTLFFGGKVTPDTQQEVAYFLVTAQTLEDLQAGNLPSGVDKEDIEEEDEKNKKGGRK
ncbi:hypothetical protein [Aquibacillus albus]|uniref:Chromosome segregation ATPase n=1 Tax=Aquibacillus albus TaxID=1168171 RepID=A0ABS2N657_9BACI|nr:hypothetical protein [Aquibacillus albus]MBM7573639.1 chromosome segregation ATPase [Aquibacillus albus]